MTSDKYIIKKGVPIPTREMPNTISSVLRKMEFGDCIDVPKHSISAVHVSARKNGIKVTYRTMKEGDQEFCRVWVIEVREPEKKIA